MKTIILIIPALVAAGVVGATLSIPDASSLGYMRFRDGDYTAAREVFDQRWKAGDRSLDVIMPLVEIYRMRADPDRGIAVFESLVETRPSDVAARRMLGSLYRQALRSGDYARNLEILSRMDAPAGESKAVRISELRELSRLYRLSGQIDRHIDALGRLAELTQGTDESGLQLAELLATQGRVDEAIGALVRLDGPDHGVLSTRIDGRQFLIDLLQDAGRWEEAAMRIERWIARAETTIEADEIAHYASMLVTAQRTDLAAALLTSLRSRPGTVSDEVFQSLARLHLDMGRPDRARDTLIAWQGQTVAPDKQPAFIMLALNMGLLDLALTEVEKATVSKLPQQVLVTLAEAAFFHGRSDVIARLEVQAGTDFYAGQPVFAAELAAERKQTNLAREWALRAATLELPTEIRIRLGTLMTRIGLRSEAEEQLRKIASADPIATSALDSLALLFVNLDQAPDGYRYFVRASSGSTQQAAVWGRAWLAAASRRGDEVIPLIEQGVLDDPSRLQTLFFIASDNGDVQLAAQAGSRLFQQQPSPEVRTWLAQALIRAGKPAEALAHLRELLHSGAKVAELYGQALEQTGATPELIDLLKRRAADSGLPAEQRRDAAFRLLRAGEAGVAQAAFLDLAASASPDSPDLRELLFLWGPRPERAALDWLEHRAKSAATAQEMTAWLSILATKGGASRVVKLVDKANGWQDALRDVLILALQKSGPAPRLGAEISTALQFEQNPDRLVSYAQAAEAARLVDVAKKAWARVLDLAPEHPEALRRAAALAAAQGNPARTADLLGRLLAVAEGDFDVYYQYADALVSLGRKSEARPYLETALAKLRARPTPGAQDHLIEARILGLLGRSPETPLRTGQKA